MVARNRGALAQKQKVRGRPFQPGNPGRPPGSKNKTTRLVEQLVEGDAEKLSEKCSNSLRRAMFNASNIASTASCQSAAVGPSICSYPPSTACKISSPP